MVAGDILLINQNNYNGEIELFNGDMVKVIEAANEVETREIPLEKDEKTGRRKHITISWRKVKICPEGSDMILDYYIIDTLLNSINRDLSID